jgi:hypothetical protein
VTTKTLRIFVTLLLVASAALFATGVAVERDSEHGGAHSALEVDYVLVADEHAEHPGESAAQLASEKKHGERVFGIEIESPALVAAAVAVSLLLAAGLWLTGSVVAPLALAAFALVAAIFDVREVLHQIDESRTNLTVIAAIVAALHLAVLAGALGLARRSRADGSVAAAP